MTDAAHTPGHALVATEANQRARDAVGTLLAQARVPVIGGFIGSTSDGIPTTRSGVAVPASPLPSWAHALLCFVASRSGPTSTASFHHRSQALSGSSPRSDHEFRRGRVDLTPTSAPKFCTRPPSLRPCAEEHNVARGAELAPSRRQGNRDRGSSRRRVRDESHHRTKESA